MDPRKIQFLIAMQREIDKVEAREGETSTRVERLKSQFYDVVEVAEMVGGEDITEGKEVENSEESAEKTEVRSLSTNGTTKKDSDFQTIDRTKSSLHNPKHVVEFLKKFRNVNDSGLRELVHPPYDEEGFDLRITYDKLKNELFPDKPENQKTLYKDRIPNFLWTHIRKDLVNLYRDAGLSFWEKTGKHPLFNDERFTKKVIAFTRSIRFGRDKSTETSFREEVIPSILNELQQESNQTWLNENCINFQPDTKKFDANMVVMSDVSRIKTAIKTFLRLISQKSNWHGKPIDEDCLSLKRIEMTALLQRNQNKELVTILEITDTGSWCDKHPDYLFNSGDFQGVIQNLWSLCEWEVIARFADDQTYWLDMLNSKNQPDNIIEPLTEEVFGFTHRLTFYH